VGAITATLDPKTPVEIWFQDEMRRFPPAWAALL
jgi:hypothetical protein